MYVCIQGAFRGEMTFIFTVVGCGFGLVGDNFG
jgi:hypothetical protein